MTISRKHLIIGLALTFTLIAVQGATAQSDPDVYYACVNNSSGTIKVFMEPTTCHDNEVYITWNTVGPEGPQGPPGGLTGVQKIQGDSLMNSDSPKSLEVDCPAGTVATGGGYNINGGGYNIAVRSSAPLGLVPSAPYGWGIAAHEIVPTDVAWQIFGFVVCTDAP